MADHPALISAKRAIALAPRHEKLRVIERSALSLGELVSCGELSKADVVDCLCEAGDNVGCPQHEVEHVVASGIAGVVTLVSANAAQHRRTPLPGIVSAAALQRRVFPPLKFVVSEVLPEGLTLLAGAPKIGKSWLGLDMALAVAAGRFTLGDRGVDRGDVLYLALEDGEARIQRRLCKLLPTETLPDELDIAVEWPQGEAGVAKIDEWCEGKNAPRLVVIDVLEKFRKASSDKNVYGRDYGDLSPLQKLATRRRIAVLVVHHTRKGAAEAPVEQISGTLALPGAADAWLVLRRTGSGSTLTGSGRDAADVDLAVEFNHETCRWTVLGQASEVRRSTERGRVLEFLEGETAGASPSDVAAELSLSTTNARQLLRRMSKAGEITRVGHGLYFHPQRVTSVTLSPFEKKTAGTGLTEDGDKVTGVTAPEWQLPLVTIREGGGGG